MRIKTFFIAAILVAVPASTLYADGLPDLGESAQADFSPIMEKKVGESFMREIRWRDPTYLDDAEVTGYLNRIGKKLASNSDNARQEFEFFAMRDPTINAFAMPGGFIGIHTALISAAQSESELAAVFAHEISHVTQRHLARGFSKANQAQMATWVSIAIAILASRVSPDMAYGAFVAGQAAEIQQQLNFTRDFEREADRVGLQLLERSGFDIRGMADFFMRLDRATRIYEGLTPAPSYLRTHPLSTERFADMENRIQQRPYRQVLDSLDFHLVRAKIKAQEGAAEDVLIEYETQLRERKFSSEAGARFGLAVALYRNGKYPAAEAQLAELRRLKVASSMIETLAAELRIKQNDEAGSVRILRAAAVRYPTERAITYDLVDALLAANQPQEALKITIADLQAYTTDAKMHLLQAKTYAMLGKILQQHRALGEAYALQGQLMPAIQQFEMAQKAPDGDYFALSQVDARLRQLKKQHMDELKEKRQQ
jgi:predicted Zn-dependent protease